MPIKCRTLRLCHHGENLRRIKVANSEVIVLHPYVDGATNQEESCHINIDSLGGPKIEKGGVSSSSGMTKGKLSHHEELQQYKEMETKYFMIRKMSRLVGTNGH